MRAALRTILFGGVPRPTLDLDFRGGVLDSRITFTRGSSATFVGSNGLIQSASTNIPRFDYDPVSLAVRGLLIEESRTNSCLRSEEFGTTWSPVRTSVSSNSTTAPDGNSTADTLVEDTANNTHAILQSVNVTSGNSYTWSVYVKPAGRTNFNLRPSAAQFSAVTAGAVFNLSTLTVTTLGGCTAASITDAGNGWARVIATAACTATAASNFIGYLISTGTTDSYTGDGASGVHLWGSQIEAGAFPTSYIPTTSATVTRAIDDPHIGGAAFLAWYNQSQGTFVAEVTTDAPNTIAPVAVQAQDVAAGDFVQAYVLVGASTSTGGCLISLGGVTQVNMTTANTVQNRALARVAVGYEQDNVAVVLNSGAPQLDLVASSPQIADRLYVGRRSAGASQILVRRIRYWPKRLPNATLQALTR